MAKKKLSVPEKHQRNIAIKTLKYSDIGAQIMGGTTKEEARKFLKSIGYTDREIKKLEESKQLTENAFRQMIRDAISEYIKEQEEDKIDVDDQEDKTDIEETSTTGGVAGYQTPAAFVGRGGKPRKKKWLDDVNKSIGYTQVADEEDADELEAKENKKSSLLWKVGVAEGVIKEEVNQEVKTEVTALLKKYSGQEVPDSEVHAVAEKHGISPDELESFIYSLASAHVNEGDYDEWKNTRIQAKNIFRMLKQKHKNNISDMKKGLELILKQNKTKDDQAKIMWSEFNKYFKIKENVTEGRRGAYQIYRDDESRTPRQKIGDSVKRMRANLKELNKEVNLNLRLKTESGIESPAYWKRTKTDLRKMEEHIHIMLEKIRRF